MKLHVWYFCVFVKKINSVFDILYYCIYCMVSEKNPPTSTCKLNFCLHKQIKFACVSHFNLIYINMIRKT